MFCLISNEITSTQAASSSPQVRVTLSSMVQIYYSPLICPVARSSCLDPSRPQHPAVKGFAVESCIKNFSVRCLIPLASDFSVCLLGLGYENQRRPVPCSQLVISCTSLLSPSISITSFPQPHTPFRPLDPPCCCPPSYS